MNTIYQITFQLDAFQNDSFQTYTYPISAATGMLQVDGSSLLLESFFKNTDLYLGLWYGGTPTVSASLSGFANEIVYSDYSRILIPKNDFVFNKEERTVSTNREYSFNPTVQNWNVSGYFLCTSLDNSGIFIDITPFSKVETLEQFKYLNIKISISILGQLFGTFTQKLSEIIIIDFLANGDIYAGYPSTYPAKGTETYTLSN